MVSSSDVEVRAEFPIAETFTSVQGEGMYAGTRMFFIRLAGCNVGKYEYDEIHQRGAAMKHTVAGLSLLEEHLASSKKHSICTSATGQRFMCDTDYHKIETVDWLDLGDRIINSGCKHINFTGGEPLLHDLSGFVERMGSYLATTNEAPHIWHIETSGTKPVGEIADWCTCITCSPKKGFLVGNLRYIHQLKFVVGNDEELLNVRNLLTEWRQQLDLHLRDIPVYISPVAPVSLSLEGVGPIRLSPLADYINSANRLTNSRNWDPTWRLNLQQHKILGVR